MLFATLLYSVVNGDTFELPRHNRLATTFKTEEIDTAGQKRTRILTDHFDISSFSTEEGTLVGQQLEHLLSAWELLFDQFLQEANIEPAPHRHKIILYRDKQEYTANLLRLDPSIARSNGYYSPLGKTAYFFSPETRVLFHEGTHQILEERFFGGHTPAFRNNFWLIEGIALFMQTLKIEEKCYKIGNILDDRLFAAREYQFRRNYHLPIRKLTAMSMAEIQTSVNLQEVYSQSATLVHWLMFAEEGRYRKHLFELLRQTYHDSAKPDTLSELIGLSYEELDKKYMEFLKTIPE